MSGYASLPGPLGAVPPDGLLPLSTWTVAQLVAAGVPDTEKPDEHADAATVGAFHRADPTLRGQLLDQAQASLRDEGLLDGTGDPRRVAEIALLRSAPAARPDFVRLGVSNDQDAGGRFVGGTDAVTGNGVVGPDGAVAVLVRWVRPADDTVVVSVRTVDRLVDDVLTHLQEHGSPATAPVPTGSVLVGGLHAGRFGAKVVTTNISWLKGSWTIQDLRGKHDDREAGADEVRAVFRDLVVACLH